MDYFTYLTISNLKDTKENLIDYLMVVVGYTYSDALKYTNLNY